MHEQGEYIAALLDPDYNFLCRLSFSSVKFIEVPVLRLLVNQLKVGPERVVCDLVRWNATA